MPGSPERDRQHEVMRLLEEDGRVSVPDLAERFGVSLVTVRKDLERLERRRLLRRIPRGAVPACPAPPAPAPSPPPRPTRGRSRSGCTCRRPRRSPSPARPPAWSATATPSPATAAPPAST